MEQVWKLEQKAEEEKRKIEELKKEREEERKQEELEKMVAVPSENLDLWIDQVNCYFFAFILTFAEFHSCTTKKTRGEEIRKRKGIQET
jgi:hypothetical protein